MTWYACSITWASQKLKTWPIYLFNVLLNKSPSTSHCLNILHPPPHSGRLFHSVLPSPNWHSFIVLATLDSNGTVNLSYLRSPPSSFSSSSSSSSSHIPVNHRAPVWPYLLLIKPSSFPRGRTGPSRRLSMGVLQMTASYLLIVSLFQIASYPRMVPMHPSHHGRRKYTLE